jgi:hypothetical protein
LALTIWHIDLEQIMKSARVLDCMFALTLVTSHATGDAPVKNNTKTQSADQRFELVINQRAIKQQELTANPPVIAVTQGQLIELVWTTDEGAMLHLHGYDIMFNISPEQPSIINFKAYATGRFPVIAHQYSGQTVEHYRAMLYLEVYPK